MQTALAAISSLIAFGCYFPYMADIVKGRVVPARSARIMFAALMLVALLQQRSLGSGWALSVTAAEAAGSLAILVFALKKGVGGLSRLDIGCYLSLFMSVIVWLTTKNAFLALHLTVLADLIAFTPTIVKTWLWPESETPLFFIAGTVAPLFSIAAQGALDYAVVLFPAYLSLANAIVVGLIFRKSFILWVWIWERIQVFRLTRFD